MSIACLLYTSADFTSNSLYSLSEKSTNIISSLNKDINIYTLYSPGNENRIVTALLESFASENSRIKLSNVDPSGSRQEISFVEDSASIALGSIVVALKDGSRSVSYTHLKRGAQSPFRCLPPRHIRSLRRCEVQHYPESRH